MLKCFGYKIKIDIEKTNKIISDNGGKDNTIKQNDAINIEDIIVKKKKYRKKNIPATIRRLTWNKYIGEEIGKAKCLCCNVTDITQLSFHCGHVIAEKFGGENTVENLRPICQNCNSSMHTTNFYDFKKMLEK
jgi:5-methylcytosine-specific restriction endonuclease McrA